MVISSLFLYLLILLEQNGIEARTTRTNPPYFYYTLEPVPIEFVHGFSASFADFGIKNP